MARPTLKEAISILSRNMEILKMDRKGYPRHLISGIFHISEGQVSKIINKGRQRDKVGSNRKKRSVLLKK